MAQPIADVIALITPNICKELFMVGAIINNVPIILATRLKAILVENFSLKTKTPSKLMTIGVKYEIALTITISINCREYMNVERLMKVVRAT